MAIIGHFTKQENGGYTGSIETLTLSTRATLEPVAKRGDKSPDYRITFGLSDIGAAWRRSRNDGEHLSVQLGDPSFAAPIHCRLVKSSIEDGFSLIWERERKRSNHVGGAVFGSPLLLFPTTSALKTQHSPRRALEIA
jgi:uncharacterized protein (DUF736 family)